MKHEQLKILPIKKIVDNNQFIKTFYFEYELAAKPGQFVWFWLPGVSDKPFSVGYQSESEFGLTICQVGNATKKIFELKEGDKVGIKGPYGTNYDIGDAKNIVLVGGGYGSAPLSFLATEILKLADLTDLTDSRQRRRASHRTGVRLRCITDLTLNFIIGTQTKNLFFINPNDFDKRINFHFTTDDGSFGTKGRVTEVLEKLLENDKIDYIATCGPELMMLKIVDLAEKFNVQCQISLERYMKCSCGICGQCVVDPLGIRMCTEGPVIDKELARKISEFGKFHRDASGQKIDFNP